MSRTSPQTPSTDHQADASRQKSVEDVAHLYDDMAAQFARWRFADRLFAGPFRKRLFGDAKGRVLDVACGTGVNFRYLPETTQLVGVDVSSEMVAAAEAELQRLRRGGTVYEMDAQDLQFPDDSFDTVISALSTCTFPDPVAALDEMARVCKPDGRVLLFEHGRSDNELVGRFQDWRADAHYEKHACRWTQEPLENVAASALDVVDSEVRFLGMVTSIEARPAED
jgi:ubiquinone/menaquinone biosynthesis C-methylase UbiE